MAVPARTVALPAQRRRRYPRLSEQIADADRLIYPFFAECDATAQVEQNRHRRFTILAMAVLTTVFGALQAWLQTAPWPGVVVATLGAATSALTTVARRQGSLQNYLTARVRAERLRSLYFEYLASSPATDEAVRHERLRDLERQVVKLQSEPVGSMNDRRAEFLDAYRQHRITTQQAYYAARAERNESARRGASQRPAGCWCSLRCSGRSRPPMPVGGPCGLLSPRPCRRSPPR
jgi:hypothetical protein